ncbi:hypothetical protein CBER1_11429 [Cercospora berteroae]|uniref:DUF6590 domain-containing protein n=1 Tax=Cercospora berteroae TaxID=357750 RepID=A0A2S6BZX6_9PEZI|nr:hypothetical protein CBER1_11429 [Cercospora berteroae]
MADRGKKLWDAANGAYYYHDHMNREYVYENGRRVAWPPQQPRTTPVNTPLNTGGPAAASVSPTSQAQQAYLISAAGASPPPHNDDRARKFQPRHRDWFKKYRVLMWRPVEEASSADTTLLSNFRDGDDTISGVGKYVVVEEPSANRGHVVTLPISTYGRRGVAADDVVKQEHGVIHTSVSPPVIGPSELPTRGEGGIGMVPNPVRVVAHSPADSLHAKSRIHYGQPTRIPVTAWVYDFGTVHENSTGHVWGQYQYVTRIKEQAINRAREASQYQTEYRRLRTQGELDPAVLQYLTKMYQRSHPGLTWEEAWAAVRSLLERGN